jgi:hypothetical protein
MQNDPRTPELFEWLAGLELGQRLAVMQAIAFTFPLLKHDPTWQADISKVLNELRPTPQERADILAAALHMSGRLERKT